MKKSNAILIIALSMVMASCEKITGDGPVVTQTRYIVNFSGVDLRCSANVYYKQDNNYKLEISAQQNILDVMVTEVSNGRLVIRFKNDVRVRSHEEITILISSPEVNSLRISGSGNIITTSPLTPNRMDMDVSGSGNISVPQLTTGYVTADISGSGNIRVDNGTATEEKLRISGSGNIDLLGLPANRANTATSGSGETRVFVSQNLDVTISGSGSVYYKGNPLVNTSISGSGKVIHL